MGVPLALTDPLTRRSLFAVGGAALAAATLPAIVEAGAPACTVIHDRLVAEFEDAMRTARLAGNNLLTAVRDIACPCCGEPLLANG